MYYLSAQLQDRSVQSLSVGELTKELQAIKEVICNLLDGCNEPPPAISRKSKRDCISEFGCFVEFNREIIHHKLEEGSQQDAEKEFSRLVKILTVLKKEIDALFLLRVLPAHQSMTSFLANLQRHLQTNPLLQYRTALKVFSAAAAAGRRPGDQAVVSSGTVVPTSSDEEKQALHNFLFPPKQPPSATGSNPLTQTLPRQLPPGYQLPTHEYTHQQLPINEFTHQQLPPREQSLPELEAWKLDQFLNMTQIPVQSKPTPVTAFLPTDFTWQMTKTKPEQEEPVMRIFLSQQRLDRQQEGVAALGAKVLAPDPSQYALLKRELAGAGKEFNSNLSFHENLTVLFQKKIDEQKATEDYLKSLHPKEEEASVPNLKEEALRKFLEEVNLHSKRTPGMWTAREVNSLLVDHSTVGYARAMKFMATPSFDKLEDQIRIVADVRLNDIIDIPNSCPPKQMPDSDVEVLEQSIILFQTGLPADEDSFNVGLIHEYSLSTLVKDQSVYVFLLRPNSIFEVIEGGFLNIPARELTCYYLSQPQQFSELSIGRTGFSSIIYKGYLFVVFGEPSTDDSSVEPLPVLYLPVKAILESLNNRRNPLVFHSMKFSNSNEGADAVFINACILPDYDNEGQFYVYGGFKASELEQQEQESELEEDNGSVYKIKIVFTDDEKPDHIQLDKLEECPLPKKCQFSQKTLLNWHYLSELGAFVLVDTKGEVHAFKPGQKPVQLENFLR